MSEYYNAFLKQIISWQYELNRLVSGEIRGINDENFLGVYATIIGIAFLYGLIHAAGPGHGKALVAFYFAKGKESYKSAFKLGYLISLIHAVSALAVTFGIFFIIEKMFRHNFDAYSQKAMLVSAVMILTVGLYIVVKSYLERRKVHEGTPVDTKKSRYAIAFSVGVVPCPGVMTIVLFCIMLKQFTLGILAAVAMSIGMGLTISIAGILSVVFAEKMQPLMRSKGYILEMLSGVLIIALGGFLLAANLQS